MKKYRTREGPMASIDTKTQLTTCGSQTAPGPLLVPGGMKYLTAAWVSFVSSNEAADGYSCLARLEGPGIRKGPIAMAAGSGGTAVATGSASRHPSVRIPLNLEVQEGQEILIFGEILNGDMGTHEGGVTLEFDSQPGPEGVMKGEVTVEGEVTAIDTLTSLTAQGSISAPSRLTPPDAKKISSVVVAVASDCAADGEATLLLRLSGDAIRGGEQVLVVGSDSWIDVAAGGDGVNLHMPPHILKDLEIEVTPNETLDIALEMAGVDVGTVTGVVTAIFQ